MKLFKINTIILFTILVIAQAQADMTCLNPEPIPPSEVLVPCFEYKETYNTTTPKIKVFFNDDVQIIKTEIIRIGDLETEQPDPSNLFKTLQGFVYGVTEIPNNDGVDKLFEPTNVLSDGVYVFLISGFNPPNLLLDTRVVFEINASKMNFWVHDPSHTDVTRPEFAVSKSNIANLTIETERPTRDCRYSISAIPTVENLRTMYPDHGVEEALFIHMTDNFSFTKINDSHQKIQNFRFSNPNIPLVDNEYMKKYNFRELHLICEEEVLEDETTGEETLSRYSYKTLYYKFQNTAPSINTQAIPSTLSNPQLPRSLINVTSNQATTCVISTQETPIGNPDIPELARKGTIFEKLFDYDLIHENTLFFSRYPSPHTFNLNITCANLANISTLKTLPITIGFQEESNFIFEEPKNYVNTASIPIKGRISITEGAECHASLNEEDPSTSSTKLTYEGISEADGRREYEGSLSPNIEDGEHDAHVSCTGLFFTKFSQKFTLDTTPPSTINITTDSEIHTCSLTGLKADFKATDETSGVSHYEYEINHKGSPVLEDFHRNGTSSKQLKINMMLYEIEGDDIELKVRAVDRAGNFGSWASRTLQVTDDNLTECDVTKPLILLNKTQLEDKSWDIAVNCSDDHSGCKEQYTYSIHINTSEKCSFSNSKNLKESFVMSDTARYCVKVCDNNDNCATKTEILEADKPRHCYNNVLDGDETGVDCGGSCSPCGLGENCSVNNDCTSNFCHEGVCTQASCDDGLKSGDQTDVDCGGFVCDPCGLGMSCLHNTDCESRSCESNVCVEATCFDGKPSGLQTDVDCGGPNCNPCRKGQRCSIDSDCETGYCDNGVCKDESERLDPNDIGSEEEKSMLGIIFLVLGFLLMIGGGVLLYLENEKKKGTNKQQVQQERQGLGTGISRVATLRKSDDSKEEVKTLSPEEQALRKQAWEKSLKEKEQKRKEALGAFDSEETKEKEDVNEYKEIIQNKKETEETPKPEPTKKKIIKKKPRSDEFVELSSLKEEDDFEKLKKASNQKETEEEPKPEPTKKKTKKKKTKDEDDVFKKLKNMTKK